MEVKLIGLSIFFCIIQSSFGLKCYTCNTDSFSKCSDLKMEDNTFAPQDCSLETYLNRDGKLIDPLGFGERISSPNKDMVTPTCLKITSHNQKTGAKTVDRLCTFKLQNQDTCTLARVKLLKSNDDIIDFCGTCDGKDGCNNGNPIKIFYSLIILGAIVSAARFFA